MTAPDPILTAVTEAILGEEATVTYGYYGTTSRIDAEHAEDIARLALAAARPLIEAGGGRMSPDPVLEAVAQALHGDECPDDPDYGDPCRCDPTSYDREAEVAVAAARPLIEAEVREAVAREIEAAPSQLTVAAWGYQRVLIVGDAARIARGSDA